MHQCEVSLAEAFALSNLNERSLPCIMHARTNETRWRALQAHTAYEFKYNAQQARSYWPVASPPLTYFATVEKPLRTGLLTTPASSQMMQSKRSVVFVPCCWIHQHTPTGPQPASHSTSFVHSVYSVRRYNVRAGAAIVHSNGL